MKKSDGMHPKYVVPILSLLGIIIAIMVGIYGLNIRDHAGYNLKGDNNTVQDSLKDQFMVEINGGDSLRVKSFPNKFVILDFWATYVSSFVSKESQQLLRLKNLYPAKVEVIVADVKDKNKSVEKYMARHHYPFKYVDGSKVFNQFHIPRAPLQMIYAPGGKLIDTFTGPANSAHMDSLWTIVESPK